MYVIYNYLLINSEWIYPNLLKGDIPQPTFTDLIMQNSLP